MRTLPLPAAFAALLLLLCASLAAPIPAAAQGAEDLGVVRPQPTTRPSVIAIPAFGKDDNAPVDFETVPRIIRRDLELTGWFRMPADQAAVNSQNLVDVRGGNINFAAWSQMGVEFYAMGHVSMPSQGTMRVRLLLYEVGTRRQVLARDFDGPANDIRWLAHAVSDQIVESLKFEKGFAQTRIAFSTATAPGIREIAVMDSDGFNPQTITNFRHTATAPSWGRNGQELIYLSYHGNRANLYGQILQTGQVWTIAAYGGTNHSAEWSEAAQRVVMTLSRDGNSEIYTSRIDGKDLRRLTTTRADEGSPAWSPDGRQIVFVSNETGNAQLFIMNADGSGKRRLTTRGTWNDQPSWSPDGRRIAFASRISGRTDIFTVRPDGSDYKRLTMNQGNNEAPSWAPNSRHIAFQSDRSGTPHIWIMLDDGSNQRALTTSGRNFAPAWGPTMARRQQ